MKEIKINEMKRIQVEILKYIDRICNENRIDYFLLGGSLIGAVRHNGFIPWDDDIDIAMTEDNYKKFKQYMLANDNPIYKMLDSSINEEYYLPFIKMVDSRTILFEKNVKEIDGYGVFVDVFCYYPMPNNEKERNKMFKKIKKNQRLIFYYATQMFKDSNLIKRTIKKIIRFYTKILGAKRLVNKYNKAFNKHDYKKYQYSISNWPLYKMSNEVQISSNLKNTEIHVFEDMKVKIPKKYDEILTTAFGNYMLFPPEDERKSKHSLKAYWR